MQNYASQQGYPLVPLGPAWYRSNWFAVDLAPQAVGADVEVLISVGDDCLDFVTTPRPGCRSTPNAVESITRHDNDRVTGIWAADGLAHTYATYKGGHYGPDGNVYETWYVDRLNSRFSRPTADPFRFSYKTVNPAFSMWGYEVAVQRPNAEFLNVLGARMDGREFTLAGTGSVTVTTPPTFHPGRTYRLLVGDPHGGQQTVSATADGDGRLSVTVDLAPTREVDERRELVEAGLYGFPQTHVVVADG